MRLVTGHFQALSELFSLLMRHWDLTMEMVKREFSDRYAGQVFGTVWAIAHPIFLIGLYVFIFAFVFKMKIGGTVEMPLDYTVYILSGLVAWLSFQESMAKSCSVITANINLVKQVAFPLEILPVKGVLASLFPQLVGIVVLTIYTLLTHGSLHITYLLIPVLITLQVMAMIGIAFILAPIGAYFRDIKDFVQLFVLVNVYLMPVFYLPNWAPELFKPFLYLNPFSYLIWCYQDVFYYGRIEHPWAWLFTGTFSPIVFILGYRFFRKLKPLLGDVV